ncbi:MAG: helix-turn-helix domain-containing protein [Terriglobales bacterium]
MKPTYTVNEVAAILGMSRRTVIRIFEGEPGVLELTRPEAMHKRRYRSLRIPRAVIDRVLARLSRNGAVAVKYMRRALTR